MNKTQRLALSAQFIAMMLIVGYFENMFNIGVPGVKLGISNSVLLLVIYWLGIPAAYQLMLAKVVLSGLMFGGVSAIPYSLAGGLLSVTSMALLSRMKGMSPIGAGVAGGVMHNVGQMVIAMLILQNTRLAGAMALLMMVGAFTGAVVGALTIKLMRRLPSSLLPRSHWDE